MAAGIYDRAKLKAGNLIAGPAMVVEMDATTLILPDYVGEVDAVGNILIRPAKKPYEICHDRSNHPDQR